jgi:hypothetical protein
MSDDAGVDPDVDADVGGKADAEIDAVERGTEHLQTAAREMLSAARAFLDAVEDLVEDPDRIKELGHAVGTVAQQVARVGRSAMSSQSETAWFDQDEDGAGLGDDEEGGEPLF